MSVRPKTLLLIHHSHTDVGYTEMQGRVARRHADFLRQALRILRERPGEGFRWTCECFWGVERFLERAGPAERNELVAAVQGGRIGLSASYLNLNELPDLDLLRSLVRRAADFGRGIGVAVDSAMTADVNGYGWGFATALLDGCVGNLFTAIHTHHGMYPLGKQQTGFLWEAPDGRRLLVWSGEHYHFGNELGVVPGAVSSYLTKDECDAAMIFGDHYGVARIRIPRYWEKLEAAGHPLDFAPVMASGLRTDNGPPSPAILDFTASWNAEHGDRYPVEMVTLSGFFARLRAAAPDLPVHRGDWPDWWSDGLAGDPGATKLFRAAQRGRRLVRRVAAARPEVPEPDLTAVEDDLALYAEHTFGHSDSVTRPWHPLVLGIEKRKESFAARAFDRVTDLLDEAAAAMGGTELAASMPLAWLVLNPFDHEVVGLARLGVGHYEFHELGLDRGGAVRDVARGECLPTQREDVPRGAEFCALLALGPGEARRLELVPGADPGGAAARADGKGIRTPSVELDWAPGAGIGGMRIGGADVLRPDRPHAPFAPVTEITPVPDLARIAAVRGEMVLNRKGPDVERGVGVLREVLAAASGPVFAAATLSFDTPRTRFSEVRVRAFADAPRIDVAVRMLKDARWEPENVHVPLPLAPPGETRELWIEKAGAVLRPRRDQVPGTLTDFYCLQEGFAVVGGGIGVAVATWDAPLLQVGPLEPGPRRLAGEQGFDNDPEHLYSWVMTNYWETNFAASLGGFHEFRYSVAAGPELEDPALAVRTCHDLSGGLFCVRLAR